MAKRIVGIVPLVVVLAVVLSACSPAVTVATLLQPRAASTAALPPVVATPLPVTTTGDGSALALEGTVEQLYQNTINSVVNIHVVEQVAGTTSFPFGNGGSQGGQGSQTQAALGSGFVWDKNGDIVTNNHVIAGATSIEVTFHDGTTVPGKVVGADPDSDLAVVKVDAPANLLQPVTLGDSTQLKVGQLAVAIGNPFGLEGTMTVGFVSALGRSLPVDNSNGNNNNGVPNGNGTGGTSTYTIPDVIQTDASINPGNSGGVLIDDQGRVIGVTSAIVSPSDSSAGVGFAIPAAIVNQVVPSLISTGTYQHSWLGVSGATLTPDMATAMNLPATQRGALVIDLVAGGPSQKAGLQPSTRTVTVNGTDLQVGGDVIVAIDGHTVKTFDDVVAYLSASTHAGQTVNLTVLRNGQTVTVPVTLGTRPSTAP